MMVRLLWAGLAVAFFLKSASGADDPRFAKLEFFEKRIRPVLAEHCVECHGPDAQESGLRVDHISFLTASASFGRPVVVGKPETSTLLIALEQSDPELKMPMDQPKLPPNVIADFRQWIIEGAAWPDESVPRTAIDESGFDLAERKAQQSWLWRVPQSKSPPQTSDPTWARDDADAFVLAALEQQGLKPASDAEASDWLRRVHFALTGLPPSLEQVQEFTRDSSWEAREQVVDQLLTSPHFGERWARHWMDLVRYSESRGHESDFPIANAWRYRDYLIQAFNLDVPYDQFVIEHLAGDLVDEPRRHPVTGANQSVLGTGWVFLGEEVHSPVNVRQDECDRTDNKIDVLSKTFLGLTVACARCHDHKFDPITQRDYYGLAGFVLSSNYRQVRFESMEHNRQIAMELDELTSVTRRKMATVLADALRPSVSSIAKQIANMLADPARVESHRREILEAAKESPESPLHFLLTVVENPSKREAFRDQWSQQQRLFESSKDVTETLVDYSNPDELWLQDGYSFGPRPQRPGDLLIGDAERPVAGVATYAAAVKNDFWDGLTIADGTEADSGSLAAQLRSGRMIRTRKVAAKSGRLFYLMSGEANVYAGVDSHIMIAGPLHGHLVRQVAGDWAWHQHDVAASEGSRVYVQFGAQPEKPLAIRKVVVADVAPQLVEPPNAVLRSLAESDELATVDALLWAFQNELLIMLDRLAAGTLTADQDARARAELLSWVLATPELFPIDEAHGQALSDLAATYRTKRQQLQTQVHTVSATAAAWMDGNGLNENVLLRGRAAMPDAEAPRQLPEVFDPVTPIRSQTSGRLELAKQIASVENPLTARVLVNRIWHHVFGRGIVATVDNFGYLGERPSHPELLDTLAWDFMHRHAWSMKALIRRLVLSRSFAMSSQPAGTDDERADPNNVWLHRMPIRRLEAEVIRDALLAVSGRLDPTLLGRPVPVQHTEFVVGRGRPDESGPLDGAGRRTVYIASRRNFLPTLLTTFDFPTPFTTVGRRNVTNVPAQSLAMMNDPLVAQQATVWADRILREMPNASPEERLSQMFLEAFARKPQSAEVAILTASLQEFAKVHGCQIDDAAVWSDLAHSLFGTSEFIYLR